MTVIGRKRRTNLPTLSETRKNLLAAPPADELALALQFARAEKSPSTRRAYRSDFKGFQKWCATRKLRALPSTPATLATFLASEAKRGIRPSTISRRVAGIRYAHIVSGHQPPGQAEIVKATLRGIRRTMGAAPNRKAAITSEQLCAMVRYAPNSAIGMRDRALLLLGFAGALRRSELVRLDVADFKWVKAGLNLRIRTSKTDQQHLGQTIAILPGKTACPIKALKCWLTKAEITQGPVFRPIYKSRRVSAKRLSDRSVANIVKTYAKRIGIDPSSVSGHSLRAGFLTSAAQRGASVFKMMDMSRHKSLDTLSGYIRDARQFYDHAGADLL